MTSILWKLSVKYNVHKQDGHSLFWSYIEYYVNSSAVCFKLKASSFIKVIDAASESQRVWILASTEKLQCNY